MGIFKILSKNELRTRKKLTQEEIILFDQFKNYLTKIDYEDAGVYEMAKNEDKNLSKKLLRKAARSLGIRIRIIEDETTLTFYRQKPKKTNQ